MVDGGGLTSSSTLTVTITGANDAPVITVKDGDSAAEGVSESDLTLTTSGTLSVEDVDLLDSVTASVVSVVAGGTTSGLGADPATLRSMLNVDVGQVIDASHTTGTLHWSFDSATTQSVFNAAAYGAAMNLWMIGGMVGDAPSAANYTTLQPYNEAFDYLSAGEQLTLTYTVRASDGTASTDRNVVVTITGTNDAPVVAAIAQHDLTEQADTNALTTSVTVNFTDVDLTDTGHTVSVTAAHASGVTDGLALDEAGLIALLTPGLVTKNAGSSSGTVNLAFSAEATDFDYLAAGQVLTLTYTATVNDGDAGVTTRDFVVTITGTTDAPILDAVEVSGSITEGSALSDGGSITFTDVDLTDLPTATSELASLTALKSNGVTPLVLSGAQQTALTSAFSLSADAANTHDGTINWTYSIAESALNFLAADEHVTAVFTVTVADGHGGTASQNVTVAIAGTNDAPVIAAVDVTGTLAEAGGSGTLSDTGSITFTDVDLTDLPTATSAVPVLTALKSTGVALELSDAQKSALTNAFSLSAAGGNGHDGTINWTYSIAESAVDFLGEGDTVSAVFTITVDDQHGGTATQNVTVTLTGTNDAPILDLNGAGYAGTGSSVLFSARGDAVSLFDQDGSGNLTLLNLADKDDGDLLQQVVLTLDPDQALDNLGTTYETLFSTRGTGSFSFAGYTLAISGNGTSGSPLTLSGVGSVEAYKAALATLKYLDTNQNAFAGDRDISVTVTDVGTTLPSATPNPLSTTATLTVSVNWNPVTDLNGPGSLAGLPQDANAQRDYVITYTEKQPTVAYVASSTATLFDQNGLIQKVVVNLTNPLDGADEVMSVDAGVIGILDDLGISTTFSNANHTVTFEAADAFGRDVSQFQIGLRAVQYKDLSNAPNESAQRKITVMAYDTDGSPGVGATSYINVVGVNVPPTLQAVADGSVAEDALASWTPSGLSGTLIGADEDLQTLAYGISGGTTGGSYKPADVTYDVSKAGSYGTLYVKSASGEYLYVPDSTKVNALTAGEAQTESFTITVSDGVAAAVTKTYTINLTGTNDTPTVTAALTSAKDEGDAAYALSLVQGAGDLDDGEAATLAVVGNSVSYTVNGVATGNAGADLPVGITRTGNTLSVDPTDAAYNHLAVGDSTTIVVSYQIEDAQGATVAQTQTITITGTNDTPTVTAALTSAKDEGDAAYALSLVQGAGDLDDGEAATLAVVGSSVSYTVNGVTTGNAGADLPVGITRTGNTLSVDPTDAAYNHLAVGDSTTIVVSYQIEDAQGATVAQTQTITITGTNDTPTQIHLSNAALTEITGANATTASVVDVGTLSTDDVDDGDSFTYDIIGGAQQFYFQIASVAGVPTLQLKAGVPLNAEFLSAYSVVVRSTDALGLSTFQTFVVNISDVNEFQVTTPVFDVESMGVGIAPNTVPENTAVDTFIGVTASASDASNNTIIYSLVGSLAGAPYTANEFKIDAASGQISVAGPINREVGGDARTVYVKALSADGSSKIGTLQVFISDVDEFAVTAPTDTNAAADVVSENAAIDTRVGITARAVDGDATVNTVSYALIDADGAAYSGTEFEIDAVTGVVTVAGGIDRELGATRTIHVLATSADGSTAQQSFTVSVTDLDDNAPVFTSGASGSVAENAATSTVIYTAQATDADATAVFNTVSYALKDGGDKALLNIDAATGDVTLKASADFETKPAYTFTVLASDGNHVTERAVAVNVGNVDEAATGQPAISGTVSQGETLTASAGTLVDPDGLGVISYQWLADGAAISGATGSTLVLGEAQVNKEISVVASYTDGFSQAESVTSARTAAVRNVNDAPTGGVSIVGTAIQNATLSVVSTLADADGLGTVTYKWMSGATQLGTGSSYTLGADDVGRSIHVVASWTDGHGSAESVSSSVTGVVANVNDAPTGSLAISGSAEDGQTLSAVSTLADADGMGTLAYQWLADGVAISGATGSSFVLTPGQVGKAITVQASWTDGQGSAEQVTSSATGKVNAVSTAGEGGAPSIGGGTAGDGNGDGIADAIQSAVASSAVSVTTGGTTTSSYVTLVADSNAGKVADGSTNAVTSFNQTATAGYMPVNSEAPLGSLSFSASTDTVSGLETFSLYVDKNLGINGYWVTNSAGTLVNLASEAYGGRMEVDGDKLRLDFQVADGSALDHDGSADGSVQVDGAVGYVPLSLIAYTPDAPAQQDNAPIWD